MSENKNKSVFKKNIILIIAIIFNRCYSFASRKNLNLEDLMTREKK